MSDYKRLTGQKWTDDIDLTKEYGYSYIYKRLYELEDKIENGTLVELPCKVGDTVYFDTYRHGESIGVQPHKVERVEVVFRTERTFGNVGADIPEWQFGKSVFLTKSEAEARLNELQEKQR